MIELSGRAATGLDEFMLRLGHLSVLARLIPTISVDPTRVIRRLSTELTKPVPVTPESLQAIGNYLLQKGLANGEDPDGHVLMSPHAKARYAKMTVVVERDGRVVRVQTASGAQASVWYQDAAIAAESTNSKVGAVTVDVREASNKSGVSHVIDWAAAIHLTNPRLALTAEGRGLGAVLSQVKSTNPYALGVERIAFAWLLFAADGDILRYLIALLAREREVSKADAVDLLQELAAVIAADVATGRARASMRASRRLREFREDLGLPERGTGRGRPPKSTIWHRVSSRLESLVDLGLLTKSTPDGENRHFEYYYRPTDLLHGANESMAATPDISSWAEQRLCVTLYPNAASEMSPAEDLTSALRLAHGPTGVNINAFSVIAACLAAARGGRIEIGAARESLVDLAVGNPEVARLSRGYAGSRPEFASVSFPALERLGDSAFR